MAQLILDEWQLEALEHRGNLLLCTGRQCGKTTIMAIKCARRMLEKPTKIIVASLTEDQAKLIIIMILDYLQKNHKSSISYGKDKPTQNKIVLTNGSSVLARPTGNTGDAIRGFTADILVLDEVSRFNAIIMDAALPTLLTTGGEIWLCSTPFGKQGFFYDCYLNRDGKFKVIHVNAEEVTKNRNISDTWTEQKREDAIRFLESQKKIKSKNYYGQEYLALFLDDLRQFFPDELVQKVMDAKRPSVILDGEYYLGVDVAGMGNDESTFEIVRRIDKVNFIQVENIVRKKTYTNQVTGLILDLHSRYKFKRIFVDDGGLGFGVFSQLLEEPTTKDKVEAINNSKRPLDRSGKNKKSILKNDLYNNLLRMMERREISLLDDPEIFNSLKSVQCEFEDGRFRIFGDNTHIAEGLVRAAWAAKTKSLNIWISYI